MNDTQQSFVLNSSSADKKSSGKLIIASIVFIAVAIGGILAGVALVGQQQYNKSLANNCPGGSVSACISSCLVGCPGSQNPTQCANGCPGACQNLCSGGSGYVCGNGVCDAPGENTSNCPGDCRPPSTSAPTCAGLGQSCESASCCSGYVCQGNSGSRVCQQVTNGSCNSGGARCGGAQGYIGFRCGSLDNGRCNGSPQTFDSFAAAVTYAGGCGQADEVWVGGPCNRQLCGNFSVFSSSCSTGGGATNPPATTTPTAPPTKSPTSSPISTIRPSTSPTATTNAVISQCFAVKAFDEQWAPLAISALASKKAGDIVYFTVGGTSTGGVFDRARFTINGQVRPDVTSKRPGTEEFYDAYAIPAGATSLSVGAQIHHSILGWN